VKLSDIKSPHNGRCTAGRHGKVSGGNFRIFAHWSCPDHLHLILPHLRSRHS